ncbi:MAG: hypothetical protein ABR594_12030 [Pyrinomonadaceae bacterium]
MSTPAKVENRNGGVRFTAAREVLEVDVPAAVTLGKAEVEIRVKANGYVSDPVNLTATITDVTRVAETPNVSAPRVLAVTPPKGRRGTSTYDCSRSAPNARVVAARNQSRDRK